MKPLQAVMLVLKLTLTGILLWLLFRKADIEPVALRLSGIKVGYTIIALAVLFGQLLLTGVRWHSVDKLIGTSTGLGLKLATRLILVGQFFNQVLPSSVGGDGIRAWLLSREGVSIRHALTSVICDRIAALMLLAIIVGLTLPLVILYGNATIPHAWPLATMVITCMVGGLLFLLVYGETFSAWLIRLRAGRALGIIVRDIRLILFSSRRSLWVISLTVIVQVMVVSATYFCALALDIELNAVHLLLLPLIMLVSSIPISFAGWGLRESAMVVGLGFAGISATNALAVSVSFGIAQMLIGLPGAAIAITAKYLPTKPGGNPSRST